jgi:PHP family Zn ribbon phosphoesterase
MNQRELDAGRNGTPFPKYACAYCGKTHTTYRRENGKIVEVKEWKCGHEKMEKGERD